MRKIKRYIILGIIACSILIPIYFSINYIELNKIQLNDKLEELDEKMNIRKKTKSNAEYVDNCNIKIGLYMVKGKEKVLVNDDYYTSFEPEDIMGIFYAVYSNEEKLQQGTYYNVWNNCLEKYENAKDYKIGYNIKFKMQDGTKVDQIILNPDDAYLMYPEIQFYLYDDINLIPGRPYYHVTKETVTDKTIYSSMKIVGDKKTPQIEGNITLDVFAYDGKEDFDPNTGKYRGNCKYTVIIKNKSK